ncbi:MAG TPA: hypothetical protein ENK66_09315 [Arcobacter sp.]|nr:hypothetical protein [Arcobacter sp.]
MQASKSNEKNYFLYIFFFILLAIIVFYGMNYYYLQSENMSKYKEERREYYLNLDKNASIKIGVAWPITGEAYDYFQQGVQFAQKELNQQGILGRKIELDIENDHWDIAVAHDIAKKFSTNPQILAVIAHDDETLAIPTSITYEYSGLIMVSPAVSYPLFTRRDFSYIFRNTLDDTKMAEILSEAAKYLNLKKIAVLSFHQDKYSEVLAQNFMENAIVNDLEVVYENHIKLKNQIEIDLNGESPDIDRSNAIEVITDLTPSQLNTIDYDAIFLGGYEDKIAPFIIKTREKGIYAPFLTGDALDIDSLGTYGENMDNIIVSTLFNSEQVNHKIQNFIKKFQQEYGVFPDTWAMQGYDAMMLIAEAIKNANSFDPELITRELKYMRNYESIFGKYSLTPRGDVEGRKLYIKVFRNNKFHYIHFK